MPAPSSKARPVSPARRAAMEVLRRARDPHAPGADALCEEVARRLELEARDGALAREIAFGVLRRRRWLEHVLARFVERPFGDAAPHAHEAILAGLFQLLFLDRVPAHAVVHDTVELVAQSPDGKRLRGLANAVLRRISSQERTTLLPGEEDDWRLAHSIPPHCEALLEDVLPDEGERARFFAASNEPAPLCLRPSGAWKEGTDAFAARLESECLAAGAGAPRRGSLMREAWLSDERRLNPTALPLFREGLATVEDEGAQAALLLALGNVRPRRVLDLCASPGGKTAHLCDLFPEAEIVACDVSDAKRARLRETLERLGHLHRVQIADARTFVSEDPAREAFDFVLVDAPCSGFGTLRRHPEVRYRRTAGDVGKLVALQRELLSTAAKTVAPGGVLALTVCTLTAGEGEQQAARFLLAHPDFDSEEAEPLEGALSVSAEDLAIAPGVWRIWPQRHGCDGFTVVRFRRQKTS